MKKTIKMFSIMFVAFLFFGVTNVKATEYEENLIKRIAPDGKNATLKTVKPTSREESDFLLTGVLANMLNEEDYFIFGYCSESDLTDCTVGIQSTSSEGEPFSKEYNIKVTYDEPPVYSAISDYKSKMKDFKPNDPTTYYQIEDLRLINYYMTSSKSELWNPGAPARALKYSNDIIKLTKGGNLYFSMVVRAGIQDVTLMFESAFGEMNYYYNGYCYGVKQQGLYLKRVIYIPQDTENAKEAYIEAAQKRINDYLGTDDSVTVAYGGLLTSLPEGSVDEMIDSATTDGNYYNITVKGKTYKFYIMKGTAEQLVAPTYLGSDILSDITITSSNSSIPLDTSLTVKAVINDDIKEVLGTDDYKAFDISLYSNGKGASIEKLDNGKFLVKIPVPSEYEGKELVIYYINSKNETEKYNVTVKDGFASFETDHFSTYILTPLINVTDIKNPETKDNIGLYIILGTISLIGLAGCGLFLNKKKGFN